MQNGPMRPEGKITLAQISRGLAIAVGFGGSFMECTYDHFSHPIVLPYLLGFFGLQVAASSQFWRQAALWLVRAERLSVRLGPISFDREQVHQPPPPTITTLQIPVDELPEIVRPDVSPTSPPPSTSRSPNPPEERTQKSPSA